MGFVLRTTSLKDALLNVYLPYERSTSQCLQDKQSSLDDLTNYISDGCFDEIIIMGDFNCDPNKGRFFRELQSNAIKHSLSGLRTWSLECGRFLGSSIRT